MKTAMFVTALQCVENDDATALLIEFEDERTGQKRPLAFTRRALDMLWFAIAEHGAKIRPSSDEAVPSPIRATVPPESMTTLGTIYCATAPNGAPMVRAQADGEAPSSWLALSPAQIESLSQALTARTPRQ
jgi:hypothetical protein